MRTTRMTLAGLLTLAMIAAPAAAAAQSGDTEGAQTPAYWTGTEKDAGDFAVPGAKVENFPWGYRSTVGFSRTADGNDPRIAGELDIVFTYDISNTQRIGRGVGLARLVNEGGSFEGPVNVIYYPDGSEFRFSVMEGKGGHEGLTYVMSNHLDSLGRGEPQGLIWEGDMPPLPDAELLPD